ncbi:helix-turn-helix domain-containing protein [Symbiobacterium thermophilum]|uniref:helix-turn-helix domain-containing protein n=1 Tax=Symbiobacterium thermophilum TaxID=2734 RepID=UPI003B5C47DA
MLDLHGIARSSTTITALFHEQDSKKTETGLRTVQRAIDILYCFTLEEQELSLTEIANKISLAKSTTTRLLSTLE